MPTIQTPPCPVCGRPSKVTVTEGEANRLNNRKLLIQEALPNRNDDFRELFITGTHPKCWDKIFPPDKLDLSNHQDPAPPITRDKPPTPYIER